MAYCKFYQKEVNFDDDPVEDNECRAPDSLVRDVLTCGDCDMFTLFPPDD